MKGDEVHLRFTAQRRRPCTRSSPLFPRTSLAELESVPSGRTNCATVHYAGRIVVKPHSQARRLTAGRLVGEVLVQEGFCNQWAKITGLVADKELRRASWWEDVGRYESSDATRDERRCCYEGGRSGQWRRRYR